MDNNNKNFNELLIEILKQIHVRLDRLDAKIDTKADKEDVNALKINMEKDINDLRENMEKDINDLRGNMEKDINNLRGDVNSLGKRLDRIEGGIATLRWVIGAQVAIIGVLLAIFKAF